MNKILDKITLIIPTFDRPHYLLRLLRFYKSYGFPMRIIILDSSTKPFENRELEDLLKSDRIEYLKFDSDILVTPKIGKGLERISTPYSVICADDDFVVPLAVEQCLAFMEKHPDYSVAQGLQCSHRLIKGKKGKIEFDWTPGGCLAQSVDFENPAERLKHHLSNYSTSTFYGVHETKTLLSIFKQALSTTSHGRLVEILLTALTLIEGKMAILPLFYGSRESGNISIERTYGAGDRPYFYIPWSSFLAADTYKEEYKKAVSCLSGNLQKQTGLDADSSIKEALDSYLDSVRPTAFQKIRAELFGFSRKNLPQSYLKNLVFAYEKMVDFAKDGKEKEVKKEYCELLEKNDSKFYENLNKIKEAVITSEI
jgi:glycosyltransferase domain-containing protein